MHTFSEFIDRLVAEQTTVTIGSGEQRLGGTIVAYDQTQKVVTFQTGRTQHFIPLTSIRSFSVEDTGPGSEVTLELFKR